MKLYYSPGACSLASHICLYEADMKFDAERVSTKDKLAMHAIHAKGYVPMLRLDNGEVLTEGVAIMQYVADQKPELGLMPRSGLERYRALEWMNYITSEVHKGFSPLFGTERLVAEPVARAEFIKVVKDSLCQKLTWVDSQLAGKDYLLGKNFSICDAYLFTVFSWCQYVGIDGSQWKNLSTYSSRVYARPAVQTAMKAEGLLK
jgi:glutathione S-transferase